MMPSREPEPLEPRQVDALLRPSARTFAADLFEMRDTLQRMSGAFEQLAHAAEQLRDMLDPGGGIKASRTGVKQRNPSTFG